MAAVAGVALYRAGQDLAADTPDAPDAPQGERIISPSGHPGTFVPDPAFPIDMEALR